MNRLVTNGLVILMLVSTYGCRQTEPTHTICLVDVSKSIAPDGFRSEFKAVDDLVDRMHRGDRLTVIPITGNAAADTPGRVVTLVAPVYRKAYDADLATFREEAYRNTARLRDGFDAKPTVKTDILGALDVAGEEVTAEDADFRVSIIVFSDFIEDEERHRFLAIPKDKPTDLARQLRNKHHLSLPIATTVRLIKLQSTDANLLHPDEQEWIRTFWSAYFAPSGVQWTPLDISIAKN
jgi:hypothetical protein